MRISDWSSDVCSSDLFDARLGIAPPMITQRVQPRRQDQGRWHSRLVAKKRRSAPAFQVRPVTGIEPFKVRTLQEIAPRSEEHTSELQSLMRISYAVICLKKNTSTKHHHNLLTT